MRTLYSKIFVAYAILITILLTVLWFTLSQFFSLFAKDVTETVEVQYNWFLFIILLVGFALSLLMAGRLLKYYTHSIDEARNIAAMIRNNDFSLTKLEAHAEKDNDLSFALIKSTQDLQEMSNLRAMEKERLNTLIDSMGSGLIMIGREGRVNLVNGVFRHKFGFTRNQLIGKNVKTVGLPKEMDLLIESVFLTEQVKETQVNLIKEGTLFSISVYGAPVIGTDGNWLGIVVVVHDITELIQLEKIRKDFVANVSHELRTPVTSIKGFTETLLDGAIDDKEIAKEFLVIIQKESNRLQLILEDLLVLSGVEREGFTLTFNKVNINEVIYDALQSVSSAVKVKNMNIELDLAPSVYIEGDKDRLSQVMVNLLSNAIAYSREEKTITVLLEVIEDSIRIAVEDEGVGIPTEELPRLFERFYRVDRARSRDSGGTGLGLAIVKHLVEAHNGFVQVESELHVGSIFQVYLPINQGKS